MRSVYLAFFITIVSFLTVSCAYRPDLNQGNFTEQKDVNKLRKGMTQEQVKYILGTPMLTDPMNSSKWYYINYHREGWNEPEQKKLVAEFNDSVLLENISGDFEKSVTFSSPSN